MAHVLNRFRDDETGLSQAELLISLLVFVTSVLALAQLMAMGVAANYQAQERTKATSLATFQLEALKALPFDDPQLAAGGSIQPAAPLGNYSENLDESGQVVAGVSVHTRQWQIIDITPDLKRIAVTVTRNGPAMGTPVRTQLTTLRARG
jgi:Tfp pilus assembly protein PilV